MNPEFINIARLNLKIENNDSHTIQFMDLLFMWSKGLIGISKQNIYKWL